MLKCIQLVILFAFWRTFYAIFESGEHLSKKQVNKLEKSFDHKDNYSQRQIAKKFGISQSMVSKWLKKIKGHPRKKMKIPDIFNGKS